jgi:geranylgeranyl pyrophosphate synthase
VANGLVAKAKDRLSVVKESKHKEALKAFADYMVTRKT